MWVRRAVRSRSSFKGSIWVSLLSNCTRYTRIAAEVDQTEDLIDLDSPRTRRFILLRPVSWVALDCMLTEPGV
jgi:hypothetical protein